MNVDCTLDFVRLEIPAAEKLTPPPPPKVDWRAAAASATNFSARRREFTVLCKFITINEL